MEQYIQVYLYISSPLFSMEQYIPLSFIICEQFQLNFRIPIYIYRVFEKKIEIGNCFSYILEILEYLSEYKVFEEKLRFDDIIL